MFIKETFRLPYEGMTKGKIHGVKVSRNPLAWFPFLIISPLIMTASTVFMLLIYPFIMVWMVVALWLFSRKTILVDAQGLQFEKAYRRRTLSWGEMEKIIFLFLFHLF